MRAVGHVLGPDPLAGLLRGAPLRHVVLLEGAQGEVRLAAPSDLGQAHVLAGLTDLHGVQALLCVVRLIRAHVALEGSGWKGWNGIGWD